MAIHSVKSNLETNKQEVCTEYGVATYILADKFIDTYLETCFWFRSEAAPLQTVGKVEIVLRNYCPSNFICGLLFLSLNLSFISLILSEFRVH